MNVEQAREYCISLRGVTEHFPFDDVSLVFKVENKMFALLSLDTLPAQLFLKCDPDLAIQLREKFSGIEPAWHFNKKYWNQISLERDVDDELITWCVKHSYCEVLKKLPKRIQQNYQDLLSQQTIPTQL